MQKKVNVEIIFSLFLLMVFLVFLVIAIVQYDRQTRLFPLVIGLTGLILCIILFASYYIPAIGDKIITLKQKELFKVRDKEKEIIEKEDKKDLSNEFNILIWIIGFLIGLYIFGFIIAVPVFIFIFLKFREKESLLMSILITLSSWAVVYLLFIRLLKAQLYTGLFF